MENLQNILNIVSAVALAISVAISVITFILNKFKIRRISSSNLEELEDLKREITDNEKFIRTITQIIPNAIKIAESSGIIGGDNKKLLATSKILLECLENGVDFTKNKEMIESTLEDLIKLTNEVNVKKVGI